MFRFLLLLIFLFVGVAWSSPQLIVNNFKQYPFDQKQLEGQFHKAYSLFASEVGELNGHITVTISPESCLRTGYNRETKSVDFCPGKFVINAGLDSVDVINHELFHAFICSYDSEICDMQEKDYLHEALADTFAYYLQPDDLFGENFYKNQIFLRKYKSDWRPGMVQGEHERGNAFSGIFIRENYSFKKMISLFHEADTVEEVSYEVTGAPYSRLNRYRLFLNESILLDFSFSKDADVAEVEWQVPEGIEIIKSGFQFQLKIISEPETSKGFAVFKSREGKELGRKAFYFGIKKT